MTASLDQTLTVTAVDGGWCVQCGSIDAPLLFTSGAEAEKKARSLARTIARQGADAQVVIHDRGHALVGTIRYFADN